MEYREINELVKKFNDVKIVCNAVDILDEIWKSNKEIGIDDVNNIRVVYSFLKGLCVGEGLNPQEPFNWFTCFHETIFDMFLARHEYYKNGDELIKK